MRLVLQASVAALVNVQSVEAVDAELKRRAISGKMFRMKQVHTHLTNIELRHKLNNACLVTLRVPYGETGRLQEPSLISAALGCVFAPP
jgi:hypothetical protein